MKNIFHHIKKHSTHVVKHLHAHKHRYALGTFGTFAVVKMFILFAGFLGLANLVSTFAQTPVELNSGNIVTEYGCATNATNCDLSNRGITSIAPDTFVNHTNLQYLQLYDNNISSIESGTFVGLANLQVLDLNNNQLSSIDGAFTGLVNLQALDLNNNQLSSIDGAFTGLSALTTLYLYNNQISSIDGAFTGLSNLTYLYLYNNQISSIDGAFTGLSNLQQLYLNFNQITSIESGDFDGLNNLQQLGLYNNQISSIDGAFTGLSNLTYLYLYNNQISSIDGAFTGLSALQVLELGGNQISSIESGDFDGLSALQVLELGGNQISSIDGAFTGLSNLQALSLYNNQISSIDGAFAGLSNLTELYLNSNQITTLPEDIITLTNLSDNNGLNIYYNHIDYTQLPHELLTFIDTKHVTREGDWKTLGCIDSSADNYNADARQDDGSCTYTIIEGCTDPDANNYNPDARQDDGSCTYDEGGDDGDYEGNLWVTGSLYTTRNIYSGTLVILPINYGYDGTSYTFATLQLTTPFGFEMNTDIFGSDWDTYRSVPGYGGPGDQCYTQFLENTGGYVTQTNDLLEMLLPSVIYYDSGWQIDLSIMQEGFILPVTQFTTGITQSTGLTQRVYFLAEVYHFMGTMQEDEDMIAMATALADELDHGTPASTIIGDLCTTISEEEGPGLNICQSFGNIVSEIILDLSFNKQESIWTLYMENIFDRISDTVLYNSGGTYYMDFTTINPDMIIPVINYQTEILATTGATQRTWMVTEVFSGMGASDFAADIETALTQGSGGMELLSGICATMEIMDMGEGNLKDCELVGKFIKNNSSFLGLDTVPDCGANIYTTNTDNYGQIPQGILRNASVFGAFPYQEDGITFGVSLAPLLDDFHDRNRDDNYFSLHVDMSPGAGVSCVNSGNSMEITHGDIQEVYVVYEDVCTPVMGICIEGDMYVVDKGATIPFPDNVYYADDTCTIPVLPTATDVHIIGNPIIGTTLTGSYEYLFANWSQIGERFSKGRVRSIDVENTLPYLIYSNYGRNPTYSVLTLSAEGNWTQLGDSFSNGEIRNLTVDNGIPYLTYYNWQYSSYSVLMLSGDTWTQLSDSFPNGKIDYLTVDNGIPYLMYYDGVDEFSVLTLSEGNWTQLGDSFSGGQSIGGLTVDNSIPYLVYYDGVDVYSILTLSEGNWTQLGDSFSGGQSIGGLTVDNSIPYLTYYDGIDMYSVLTLSAEGNWTQLGDSFSGGQEIGYLAVDNGVPYMAYYDGIDMYSVLTLSAEGNWIQLGDSWIEDDLILIVDNNIVYLTDSYGLFVFGNEVQEGPSSYQRYRNDDPIAGATNKSYTLTSQDAETTIFFEVTPKSLSLIGLPVISTGLTIPASDDLEDPDITPPQQQSNGGGGGGSYLKKDICPETRDCSSSYYDKLCGPCDRDEYEQQKTHNASNKFLIQNSGLFNQEVTRVKKIMQKKYSDELVQAYVFAKDLGITTLSTIDQANLEGNLIRSHMAKMITNYAIKVLQLPINTGATCSFTDMATQSQEMQTYVQLACQLGLMGQNIDSFRPNDTITRAEFGTVLSRMLRGTQYEGGTPYYKNHLQALKTNGIMTKTDAPIQKEIRGRVMLMLMRAFKK